MNSSDKERHLSAIRGVLDYINKSKDNPFVLKGGTALSMCYSLNRFSEDIDLDAPGLGVSHGRFKDEIRCFCEQSGFSFRMAKDTATTQRAYINYGNEGRPLKVEVSYRRKEIPADLFCVRNGIKVYTIDEMAKLKAAAYSGRDKIRDLYDVSFICTRYFDELSGSARDALRTALEYKDLDQFDYIVQTQHDELIDPNVLEDMFLESFDKLGLLSPLADREAENDPSLEHALDAGVQDHGISLKQECEAATSASHDSGLNTTREHGNYNKEL